MTVDLPLTDNLQHETFCLAEVVADVAYQFGVRGVRTTPLAGTTEIMVAIECALSFDQKYPCGTAWGELGEVHKEYVDALSDHVDQTISYLVSNGCMVRIPR